jgi:HPt (histidine-containing phosphotransfer) domain-containing protein
MAEKSYNLDYLENISGGDQEFVKDMIQTFIVNAPEDLGKIKKWIENKNWQKVGEDAHRFASSLLFLGLDHLKGVANTIEEMGIKQSDVDSIPGLLEDLEKGCDQIIKELKRDFNV